MSDGEWYAEALNILEWKCGSYLNYLSAEVKMMHGGKIKVGDMVVTSGVNHDLAPFFATATSYEAVAPKARAHLMPDTEV